jgi:hypothetical protein
VSWSRASSARRRLFAPVASSWWGVFVDQSAESIASMQLALRT